MLNFGFEKEFFLADEQNEPVLIPEVLPMDSCGWLVEARSQAFPDPVDAMFSLRADIHRIQTQLNKINERHEAIPLHLDDSPVKQINEDVRIEAKRKYFKGLISHQNFHGFNRHRTKPNEATAGFHVSFSNVLTRMVKDDRVTSYGNFDWMQMFLGLEKAFEGDIRGTKRNLGFYELKSTGRIEYRSLPANIDMDRLMGVLLEISQNVMICS
jgi:hypothetical protein